MTSSGVSCTFFWFKMHKLETVAYYFQNFSTAYGCLLLSSVQGFSILFGLCNHASFGI